jgi:iron complex transport system substrate-binding protein
MSKKDYKLISIIAIAVILLMAILVAGCTGSQTVSSTTTPTQTATPLPTTKTVTDQVGNQVTIPYTITRIAQPYGGNTWAYIMLGVVNTQVAGIGGVNTNPTFELFYPAISNMSTPFDSSGTSTNVEQLLAASPQVLIMNKGDAKISQVNTTGIPIITTDFASSLNNYAQFITLLGNIYGGNAQIQANDWNAFLNSSEANISSKLSAIPSDQRVKYMNILAISSSGFGVIGYNNINSQIMDIGGGVNTVTDINHFATVTEEQALNYAQNASVIFVNSNASQSAILNDPAWKNIPAVENSRVYVTPGGLSSWIGCDPEVALGPIWVAQKLYPDMFSNESVINAALSFYPKYMHYNITQQEINQTITTGAPITPVPSEVIPQ